MKISYELLQLLMVGTLGMIVHAFSQMTNKRNSGGIPDWKDFVVYATYGGFAGIMFNIAAQWIFDDQIAIAFFTGMGAFTGFAGLNALSLWALERLGITQNHVRKN